MVQNDIVLTLIFPKILCVIARNDDFGVFSPLAFRVIIKRAISTAVVVTSTKHGPWVTTTGWGKRTGKPDVAVSGKVGRHRAVRQFRKYSTAVAFPYVTPGRITPESGAARVTRKIETEITSYHTIVIIIAIVIMVSKSTLLIVAPVV